MSEFKKRFQRWMNGEKVYEAGKILPEVVITADDPIKKLVEDVNARSNADFVNRVKDPNRTWIQDWEHDGYVATHKLSWAEDSGKAIVFPNVQNINGELHDFTDPKYNHGKWDALDSAIERGDTLLMTPELAKMYTENYKKYYPKGKTFDCGKPVEDDYEKFKRTLPPNQRNASEYDYSTRRYWELNGKPKDFDEAIKRKMYTLEDDGFYHANSIAWTQNGDAEFMKPNVHPTKHFEDEFYESNPEFLKKYRRTFDWTRPGFSKYERNINPLDYINLPKYDGGTDDKTYLPEYEYEATVTPQGTSLEKHKRITNEEDWLKYWGNVGAGYVNKALEYVAVPTLKALKEFTYFTPIGAATSLGDAIAAHMNGGSPEEILSATVGALPEIRFANNAGRFARYANVADDMILINPEFLQRLQEGDFVTKRRFGSAALGKIEDVLRNYKTFLRLGYANAKRQLLGTAVKNRKILPKQVQKIVDDLIDNLHLKEYWSGPFAFNSFEYHPGDMTSLSYFNMTPKLVMGQAMQDMNDIPVGSRFLVNSLSTDSYPLVVHMLDSKISPNFRLNPVTDRIVLNGMGNLHGQAAVDRINKKLQLLEMLRGMSLGRAKRYVSPIGEEQITAPFLTAERLYDKGKSIYINPANKGKFNATKKRTGKTTEQLAHSKNPLTRKRAIFALNSRKFKH